MTRLIIALTLAALAVSIAGVPLFLWSDDDSSRSQWRASKHLDDDVATKSKDARGLGWLNVLANAARINNADDFPVGKSAEHPELQRLDRLFDAGVVLCAPEIFGYDRKLLENMQSDWHVLKPNVQPSWDAWLQMPGVVVDEEKMQKCQAAFGAADCAVMEEEWDACTVPFKGTLGEGDECQTGEQCASGRCVGDVCTAPNDCDEMSGCPSGMLCAADDTGFRTCVDQPSEGDACLTADSDDKLPDVDPSCGPGRVCDVTEHCVTARQLGERCSMEKPCAYSLLCDFGDDDEALEGRCTVEPPYEEDMSDDESDEGVEYSDDGDLGCLCDPFRDGMACVEDPARDSMKCVPVTIVENGEACDDTRMCRGALGLSACINGTCHPALGVGDACDDHEQCGDDFVCVAGQCTMPHRDGQACMDSDDCIFGLECVDRDVGGESASVCGIALVSDDPYVRPYTSGSDFDGPYDGDGRYDDRGNYDEDSVYVGPIVLDDEVVIEGEPPIDEDGNPIVVLFGDGTLADEPVTGDDDLDDDVSPGSDPRVDPPDDDELDDDGGDDGVRRSVIHSVRRHPALIITF